MDRAGNAWWLWAATIFTLIEIAISLLFPMVIAPLFNKFSPLRREALKRKSPPLRLSSRSASAAST